MLHDAWFTVCFIGEGTFVLCAQPSRVERAWMGSGVSQYHPRDTAFFFLTPRKRPSRWNLGDFSRSTSESETGQARSPVVGLFSDYRRLSGCVCVCTPVSVLSFGVSEDDGRASVLSVFDVDWDQFMGTGGSTLDVTG